MSEQETPAIPEIGRRRLSEVRDDLERYDVGDYVCVVLNDKDRHQDFVIFGEIHELQTAEGLWVGGWRISDAKGRPAPELMAFIDPDIEIEGDEIAGQTISHGDIVTCEVSSAGNICESTITGVALAGEGDDHLTCGSYIIGGIRARADLLHGHRDNVPKRPAVDTGDDS